MTISGEVRVVPTGDLAGTTNYAPRTALQKVEDELFGNAIDGVTAAMEAVDEALDTAGVLGIVPKARRVTVLLVQLRDELTEARRLRG